MEFEDASMDFRRYSTEFRQWPFNNISMVPRCRFDSFLITLFFEVENGGISMVILSNFDDVSIDSVSTEFQQHFDDPWMDFRWIF
ncbi:hypothetical protein TorRG33x02_263210 [Trema orientale]|uniref:Uncharacterized protein n=1 Tax=Trema orientale TaxID=63057 RepID=A0A2P5D3Z0_TREOI|nr:hypothetical protein TorRG33x02_263210 [Trema orientale]